MILIITDSQDGLSNELALLLGEQVFFRFNIDFWYKYEFEINQEFWSIKDPVGRIVTSKENRNVLIRKPFQTFSYDAIVPEQVAEKEINWCLHQIKQFVVELCLLEKYNSNIKLISYDLPPYLGKATQMIVASKFFKVPKWKMFWSSEDFEVTENQCVKSASASAFGNGEYLFTKEIEKGSYLKQQYPWFVQQTIYASNDLTVLFIKDECFAFTLDRTQIAGLDWRREIFSKDLKWVFMVLDETFILAIKNYMEELDLQFGRLDFLIDNNNDYWFLEVNPNGEWGWLDEKYEYGIYEKFLLQFGIEKMNSYIRGQV